MDNISAKRQLRTAFVSEIQDIISTARSNAVRSVDFNRVKMYWLIGQHIMELRDKKDLIDRFIESLTPSSDVDNDWHDYICSQREAELQRIISDEKLKREETEKFVADAFRDGHITETGTAITKLLPPMDPFSPDKQYTRKKAGVLAKLKAFFDRFFGL